MLRLLQLTKLSDENLASLPILLEQPSTFTCEDKRYVEYQSFLLSCAEPEEFLNTNKQHSVILQFEELLELPGHEKVHDDILVLILLVGKFC